MHASYNLCSEKDKIDQIISFLTLADIKSKIIYTCTHVNFNLHLLAWSCSFCSLSIIQEAIPATMVVVIFIAHRIVSITFSLLYKCFSIIVFGKDYKFLKNLMIYVRVDFEIQEDELFTGFPSVWQVCY